MEAWESPQTPAASPAAFNVDRVVIGAALGVLTLTSWLYLLRLPTAMDSRHAPPPRLWDGTEVAALVVMWAVMMVAMMIPTATPMILVFARIHRARALQGRVGVPTAAFVLGYVAVWTVFSLVAAVTQNGLRAAAMLSTDMATTSPLLGGSLFIAAGIAQWTPLKRACLAACRSPMAFVMSQWREGYGGALVMGLRHGVYCLGCCWAIMALLFVSGVMNLLWVGLIATAVLLEKVLPRGDLVGRVAGLALMGGGVIMVLTALGR